MRISDWSSDVCSSDLSGPTGRARGAAGQHRPAPWRGAVTAPADTGSEALQRALHALQRMQERLESVQQAAHEPIAIVGLACRFPGADGPEAFLDRLFAGHDAVGTVPDDERAAAFVGADPVLRSEEHTSELPSLLRISY